MMEKVLKGEVKLNENLRLPEDICEKIIDEAYLSGIRVVDDLDAKEYGEFLQERAEIIKQERGAIQAAREAKLLRTL